MGRDVVVVVAAVVDKRLVDKSTTAGRHDHLRTPVSSSRLVFCFCLLSLPSPSNKQHTRGDIGTGTGDAWHRRRSWSCHVFWAGYVGSRKRGLTGGLRTFRPAPLGSLGQPWAMPGRWHPAATTATRHHLGSCRGSPCPQVVPSKTIQPSSSSRMPACLPAEIWAGLLSFPCCLWRGMRGAERGASSGVCCPLAWSAGLQSKQASKQHLLVLACCCTLLSLSRSHTR